MSNSENKTRVYGFAKSISCLLIASNHLGSRTPGLITPRNLRIGSRLLKEEDGLESDTLIIPEPRKIGNPPPR